MHWMDPESVPEITGVVERFLVNPHGEPDGLIFEDGQEVHFPPHMAKDVVAAIEASPQATVRVRGVRPRGAPVFAAVAIEGADGVRIEDHGPPNKHEKPHPHPDAGKSREAQAADGVIKRLLHGPKGERRGILLENGTIVRFPPHVAEERAELIAPGSAVAVRGDGLTTRFGMVIEARALGASLETLRVLDEAKPPNKPKPDPEHKPHASPPA